MLRKCKLCRQQAKLAKKIPEGYYVYGWYRAQEFLPFYIGKGVRHRAWRNADVNTIRIFRDQLTEEGALLIESVLIDLFMSMGAKLINQARGMRRYENGPLTL
jgi:hypothetical protein